MTNNLNKKAIIQRHRKNKNLCLLCGLDIHTGQCTENYEKADLRPLKNITNNKFNSPRKIQTIQYTVKPFKYHGLCSGILLHD